jgi:hypothetical protein
MIYHRLFQGRIRSQGKETESVKTYIYELRSSLHAGVEGIDLFLLGLGIHVRQYVSTNVEPNLNDVRVVPQGLYNTRLLLRLLPRPWHR